MDEQGGAYLNVYRQKIQSHTGRYAPQKLVHICRYVDLKYIHIQADMHFYIGAYLIVSCCMKTAFSKHTYTYARDTAHKKTQYIQIHAHTCRYRYLHITHICTVHMRYAHGCMSCISMFICVCINFTYIPHKALKSSAYVVCMQGTYAHAVSLMKPPLLRARALNHASHLT